MPFYQATGGGGGWATATGIAGWATTTSNTSSYTNAFFGACGGTATTTTTSDMSSVMWINTAVPCSDPGHNHQMAFAGYEQQQRERFISYNQEINQANEYNRIMMAQEAARAQDPLYQAERARQRAENEARELAAHRAAQEHAAEVAQKQKAIRERAKELLLSKLSAEQRDAFTKNGWFVVEGGKSKRKYRIRSNHYAGNIDVLNVNSQVLYRLCVHCAHDIPLEDHLLSQKIMLELAEDDIVKLANRHAA